MGKEYEEDEYESLFLIRDLSLFMNEVIFEFHEVESGTLKKIVKIAENRLEEIIKNN